MANVSPLLLAQLTDTHLFEDAEGAMLGVTTARSLQKVVDQLKQVSPQPDLLLLTGDLSQDETSGSYRRLMNTLQPLQRPVYWIAGNHDVFPLIEEALVGESFSAEKSFQAGGWNFILLNSAVPKRVDGELSSPTLQWLEEQLQAIHLPTVVALHHPPCPIDSDWMDGINLQNSEALFNVVDRHPHIKIVLFGHIHQQFEQERQGVHYFGCPSTCVQFKPKNREMAIDEIQPGFRLLKLYPDGSFETQVQRVILC